MKLIALFSILLALPFSASAYTYHFVPNDGAFLAEGEAGMVSGSYEGTNTKVEQSIMIAAVRGGYGIGNGMSLYADMNYITSSTDMTGAFLSKTESAGIKDFRLGLKGATEGELEILYAALLSIPSDSAQKENYDASPNTQSASSGRLTFIPKIGFQWVLPTMKMGVLIQKDFFTADGKAEVTQGGLLFTGDKKGGDTTATEIFIEGGITETMLAGFLATYTDSARSETIVRNGFTTLTSTTSASSYWTYQAYGSFTINENMRLIPAIAHWKYNGKTIKNQQILGGSLALRMVF